MFLPSWWSRKGANLRLAARAVVAPKPKMKSTSMLSLESILNFHWEVSLGDEKLTYEELKALAELKSPLVNVRGKWVTLSADEINAALEFWKKKGDAPISAREAVKMALGAGEAPGALEIAGVQASGWLSDLLAQLEGASGFEMLESPDGLEGTLRPYQSRGFSWLAFLRRWGFGACLADDMGLGKTIQTLRVQREWESRPAREKAYPAHLPDVGRRQLAERSREVHARLAGNGSPWSGPCAGGRLQEAGRQACFGPVELLALAPRA